MALEFKPDEYMGRLRTPCADCPFRNDRPAFLNKKRVRGIRDNLLKEDGRFTCHKTLDYGTVDDTGEPREPPTARHCAGAMILMAKEQHLSLAMRFAVAYGWLRLEDLDMDAPVWGSWRECADHQPKGERDQ